LKITTAHVVGLSMGGVIALEMWRQQPARLRSLVLADTFANHPEGDAILQRSLDGMTRLGMREFAEGRVGAVLQPQAAPELKQRVVENMARMLGNGSTRGGRCRPEPAILVELRDLIDRHLLHGQNPCQIPQSFHEPHKAARSRHP